MAKKLTSKLLGKALNANHAPVFSNAAEAFYDVLPENHGFVATLQIDEYFIPTLMIKLSDSWARLFASVTHGFIDPRFALSKLTSEAGNFAYLATLNLPKERKLHFPLDPTHPLVEHFFKLLDESLIFAITLRMGANPRKYSLYTEAEPNWKPVLKEALTTISERSFLNDYQEAVAANLANFAPDKKHRVLDFLGSSEPKILAENSADDILLSTGPKTGSKFLNIEWLAETHDIYLTDEPDNPDSERLFEEIGELSRKFDEMETSEISEQFRLLEKAYPNNVDLLKFRYSNYLNEGQKSKAAAIFTRIEEMMPGHIAPVLLKLRHIPDPDEFMVAAEALLSHPLEINRQPNVPKVIYSGDFNEFERIAIRYDCINGNLESAMDRFDRLVRLGMTEEMLWEPMNGISYTRLGLAAEGDLDDPEKLYEYEGVPKNKLDNYLPKTLSMLDETLHEIMQEIMEDAPSETFKREEKKIGRNDPCPCGSGKKYKRCCL